MKKEYQRILFIEILLLIIFILVFFFSKGINLITYSLILLIPLFVGIFLLGFSKRKDIYNYDVLLKISIFTSSYYFITYLLGYFTGFLNTPYSHNISGILYNVISNIIFILIIELIRWNVVKRCKYDNKYLLLFFILVITCCELVTKYTYVNLYNRSNIIYLLITTLSIFSKNILLTYLVYYNSIITTIVYRLIMDVVILFIPIVPNFGEYITGIINIVFPIILLNSINNLLSNKNRKIIDSRKELKHRNINKIVTVVILLLFLVTVILVSGFTRFFALTIGSNSMSNKIKVGDVVIIDKKFDNLKEKDIIAYRHDNKIIVHRIIDIDNNMIRTKGDNNKIEDDWIVYREDIVGKVEFNIKWIGWPTVIFNQWKSGD